MNLDEANELFETETLESMQMAQINGGGGLISTWTKGWKIFCELIGSIADMVSIENAITGGKGTVSPDIKIIGETNDRGDFTLKIEGVGSFTVDSIIDGKIYGIKAMAPTPTPGPIPNLN